jgi:uncharacterized membrane protein (UPF0127 family)
MTILSLALLVAGCAGPASQTPVSSFDTPANPAPTDPKPTDPKPTDGTGSSQNGSAKDLEVVEVTMGEHKFKMWVMDTDSKRMEGMMFLENKDFKDDEGMLFVFPGTATRNFWMKNTLVPLDIAYISREKKVLNTYTMAALDTTTPYPSKGGAMYVIEVRAGLFEKLKIGKGTVCTFPATVKAKD